MKQDLSCPIELRGYTLTRSETGSQASVDLYNLTSRRIASFDAVAKWRNSEGRSIAAPFCAERLRAGGEKGFRISLTTDRMADADQLNVLVSRVAFEDGGDDWRAGSGTIVEISPIEPAVGDELEMLRAVAGEDAVCYPRQDAQAWRCVCGKVNLNTADACERCHRDHFSAIGHTPENVRFHYESAKVQAESAHEEAEADLVHEQYLRQRSRLLKRTAVFAIVILVLAAVLLLRQPAESVAADASPEVVSLQNP